MLSCPMFKWVTRLQFVAGCGGINPHIHNFCTWWSEWSASHLPPVLNKYKATCASKPVWTHWRSEKLLVPAWIEALGPSRSDNAVVTFFLGGGGRRDLRGLYRPHFLHNRLNRAYPQLTSSCLINFAPGTSGWIASWSSAISFSCSISSCTNSSSSSWTDWFVTLVRRARSSKVSLLRAILVLESSTWFTDVYCYNIHFFFPSFQSRKLLICKKIIAICVINNCQLISRLLL